MRSRHAASAALSSALALALVLPAPATAQIPDPDDLPVPDTGAVGELLDPIGDLVDDLLETIDPDLRDRPFDNAVRLTAEDAVDAAIALSQATFEESGTVFLARDDVFADTLSSVSAQGIAGAPLLLTQTGGIDERVATEMDRLGADTVIILGNEAAISEAVEEQLRAAGLTVSRAGGPTRIETAIEIARLIAPDADTAIVLRAYPSEGAPQSQAYADALSAGPFGSLNAYPVLLTTSEDMHHATLAYIEESAISNVVVIGGEAAVSGAITDQLESLLDSVTRLAGDNRFATAIQVAGAMGFASAADPARIILSEASEEALPLWAAGYAAAAHAAVFQAPILLSSGPLLPPETTTFLVNGLNDNALHLSNEPLICNSFVDIVACETAALLMVGLLDEANSLTGGALEELLGPVLDQLIDALDGILPGVDGLSPAMLSELMVILSLPADAGLEDLTSLPLEVQESLVGLLGTEESRPSTSRQAIQIDLFRRLSAVLDGAHLDLSDPTQAVALANVLTGLAGLLGNEGGDLPLGETEALLEGMAVLLEEVLGTVDLGDLGDLVDSLGDDGEEPVTDVLGEVGGLLAAGGDAHQLTRTHGDRATGLADEVERLQRRWGR